MAAQEPRCCAPISNSGRAGSLRTNKVQDDPRLGCKPRKCTRESPSKVVATHSGTGRCRSTGSSDRHTDLGTEIRSWARTKLDRRSECFRTSHTSWNPEPQPITGTDTPTGLHGMVTRLYVTQRMANEYETESKAD